MFIHELLHSSEEWWPVITLDILGGSHELTKSGGRTCSQHSIPFRAVTDNVSVVLEDSWMLALEVRARRQCWVSCGVARRVCIFTKYGLLWPVLFQRVH